MRISDWSSDVCSSDLSHVDGSYHRLTPERSIEIQDLLEATVTMAFDECTPFPATETQAAESMRLSMRWAERSKAAFRPRDGYGLFGIVQGGVHPELRGESAESLRGIDRRSTRLTSSH